MTKNDDQLGKINHDLNWPYISHHPHRILIIGGLGSGKTNMLLNIKDQILAKYIHRSKIHSDQSINCLLVEKKK